MSLFDYLHKMFELAALGEVQGIWFWSAIYALSICSYSVYLQIRTRYWRATQGKLLTLIIGKCESGFK